MAEAGGTLMRGLLEPFILASLAESPKHGYALLKEMGTRFGSEPNRNKIYPLLARLEKLGWIARSGDGDDRSKTFSITPRGKEELARYREVTPEFLATARGLWASAPTPDSRSIIPALPDAPYPCPEARVALSREARSGALSVTLTGCPMGKYEYCPKCSVHQAFEGLRRFVG